MNWERTSRKKKTWNSRQNFLKLKTPDKIFSVNFVIFIWFPLQTILFTYIIFFLSLSRWFPALNSFFSLCLLIYCIKFFFWFFKYKKIKREINSWKRNKIRLRFYAVDSILFTLTAVAENRKRNILRCIEKVN